MVEQTHTVWCWLQRLGMSVKNWVLRGVEAPVYTQSV